MIALYCILYMVSSNVISPYILCENSHLSMKMLVEIMGKIKHKIGFKFGQQHLLSV